MRVAGICAASCHKPYAAYDRRLQPLGKRHDAFAGTGCFNAAGGRKTGETMQLPSFHPNQNLCVLATALAYTLLPNLAAAESPVDCTSQEDILKSGHLNTASPITVLGDVVAEADLGSIILRDGNTKEPHYISVYRVEIRTVLKGSIDVGSTIGVTEITNADINAADARLRPLQWRERPEKWQHILYLTELKKIPDVRKSGKYPTQSVWDILMTSQLVGAPAKAFSEYYVASDCGVAQVQRGSPLEEELKRAYGSE